MTQDRLFDEGLVTKAEHGCVTWGTGWTFAGWPDGLPLPVVGDQIRFYGGIGYPVCGADVNGRNVWFESVEDEDTKRRDVRAKLDAKREAEFVSNQAKTQADYLSLPPELQVRIDSLRKAGGREWQVHNEPYEMFVCTQAVVIASLGTEETIRRWVSINSASPPDGYEPYDYKRQHAELPGFADGHSGNTFACAVNLAVMLIDGRREAALATPQALAPLAGDPRFSDGTPR